MLARQALLAFPACTGSRIHRRLRYNRRGGDRKAHHVHPHLRRHALADPLALPRRPPGTFARAIIAPEMATDEIWKDDPPSINQRRERVRLETERHRVEGLLTLARSEERRVGKECRSR